MTPLNPVSIARIVRGIAFAANSFAFFILVVCNSLAYSSRQNRLFSYDKYQVLGVIDRYQVLGVIHSQFVKFALLDSLDIPFS